MDLVAKQILFSKYLAKLLQQADAMGYGVTLGEAYRPPEMAEIYYKQGKGILNSNHCNRLAIDINLFKDGVVCHDYALLGEWWESQSSDTIICCWGGRFKDSDHFSFEYNGIR